jgi:ABC-type transporter Mla subunit MlaD
MFDQLREHIRTGVRSYLGTDALPRLESTMSDWLTVLNGLVTQTSEASAAQQASFLNLHNGINRLDGQIADLQQQLADALANSGTVTPEMQALADQISTSLDDMKTAADTADDGFEPVAAPVEPTTPVETAPVGDEPTA